jgi:hypothetical protein
LELLLIRILIRVWSNTEKEKEDTDEESGKAKTDKDRGT